MVIMVLVAGLPAGPQSRRLRQSPAESSAPDDAANHRCNALAVMTSTSPTKGWMRPEPEAFNPAAVTVTGRVTSEPGCGRGGPNPPDERRNLMQTTTLARYGAPIAIVAGALMIITRLVILFTTPTEIGRFQGVRPQHHPRGQQRRVDPGLRAPRDRPGGPIRPRGAQRRRVRSSRLRSGGGRDDVHDRRLVVRGLCGAALGGGRTRRRRTRSSGAG